MNLPSVTRNQCPGFGKTAPLIGVRKHNSLGMSPLVVQRLLASMDLFSPFYKERFCIARIFPTPAGEVGLLQTVSIFQGRMKNPG